MAKRLLFGNSRWGMFTRIIVLFVILTAPFFYHYGITFLIGDSMYPTYKSTEAVIVEKNHGDYIPRRHDVVEIIVDGERWIKRVMGVPGDHITFGSTRLWINNKQSKRFEWIHPDVRRPNTTHIEADIIVPPNHIWVIGDNRENSAHRLVHIRDIVGKVMY